MSGWKKRNKELTEEEAIEAATEEAIPYWFKTSPLFTAVEINNQYSLHTLNKEFNEYYWIFFVFDPADITFKIVQTYADEWLSRYKIFHVNICLIVSSKINSFLEKERIDSFIDSHKIMHPVVIDHNGNISKALNVKSLPKAVYLKESELFFESEDEEWMTQLEPVIHDILRKDDPGLSFLPPYFPEKPIPFEKQQLFFNRKSQKDIFLSLDESWLKNSDPFTNFDIMEGKIGIFGKWEFQDDYISTEDPSAVLVFVSTMSNFSILGQSLLKAAEPAKIYIDINDRSVYDIFAGVDLRFDDEGSSICELKEPRLYSPVKELDEKTRNTVFRFPASNRIQIALYGLQFFNLKNFS